MELCLPMDFMQILVTGWPEAVESRKEALSGRKEEAAEELYLRSWAEAKLS